MKKEMFKEFICAFIFYLIICPFNVHALTMVPNRSWTTYNPDDTGFHDFSISTYGGYYVSYVPFNYDQYSLRQFGFVYLNNNFCDGAPFTISGFIRTFDVANSLQNSYVMMSISGQGDSYCKTNIRDNNQEAYFVCSGSGVYNHTVQLYIANMPYLGLTGTVQNNIAVHPNMNVTCDVTIDDVISNQEQNKQEIINNQNNNAQIIINNQNQNQQQTNERLDGINDSINNSDIDTDGANSFFGDFNDTDHGGISGVVTAPLSFINKLTGTCSPLTFKVLDADVELPCGDTLFWNKTEVVSFRTIWNVLFGGAILYLMVSKLFKVIDGLKNPDDSRIEVMKL